MKSSLSLKLSGKQQGELFADILLVCIVILGSFLRFYHIDKRCLSGDGIVTIEIASQPSAKAVWQKVVQDYPSDLPFFYALLHYWLLLGKSVFWLRFLSALSGILVILLSYKLSKYLFDRKTALLVSFLVATSSFRVLYNQTVRYYSLNGLLNLLSLYFFITALQNNRISKWLSYLITRTTSLYINYSSFLFFIPEIFFIIFYRIKYAKSFKRWLFCFIAIFILWLPMRGLFIRDLALLLSGDGFERVPLYLGPLGNLIYFFFTFSVGKTISPFNYPVIAVAVITYLIILVSFFRAFSLGKFPREPVIFIMSSLIITTALCAFSNYNSPRYIMASGVLYSIIISLGILSIPRKKIVLFLIIVISMLRFYALYNLYNERQYRTMELVDDWDEIASFADSKAGPYDIIIYNSNAFAYYLNKINSQNNAYKLPDNEEDMRVFLRERESYKTLQIILVDSPLSGNNLEIYQEELALLRDWLKRNNFKLVNTQPFDKDPEAEIKRKYLKRYFPEYRTTVYMYSRN